MPNESIRIFDACALVALLQRETGVENIESILTDPHSVCLIQAINLCEAAYDSLRRDQSVSIAEWITVVESFGLQVYWHIDQEILADAAGLKAQWRRISLADCFALALAHHLQGTLLTSDHHEFDPLVSAGERSISFFR